MTDRIETLVILGAGGDLTARLLLPGLASLLASPRGTEVLVIGAGVEPMTDAAWAARVEEAFAQHPSAVATRVAKASRYVQADATAPADLERIFAATTGRVALYFALPP